MQHYKRFGCPFWLDLHFRPILEHVLVEVFTYDLADVRMHPILYFKEINGVLILHESFEEALVVVIF